MAELMFIIAMNKLDNEKKIILALAIFLVVSFGFLSYAEKMQRGLTNSASWELYFLNPRSADLTFVIKNDGKKSPFTWQASAEDGNLLEAGEIELSFGQEKSITLGEKRAYGKTTITVLRIGGEKKEIYKR